MRNRLIRIALVSAFLSGGAAFAGVYEDILAAVHNNDSPAVIGLIDRGMDVNTADPAGTTLLMIAALNGNHELLEFLLSKRANFSILNRYGDSALSLAALQGHLRIVQFLGEMGAPMNQEGWAALHYAAFAGHLEVAAYLLSMYSLTVRPGLLRISHQWRVTGMALRIGLNDEAGRWTSPEVQSKRC